MGEKKVTTMVLMVDLSCEKCRKKVKKILCKIPQIHDQVWDEKKNTVTIKVVCCSPEKIKEKIICKAGDSIKSIEIVVPEKPKPPPAEKPKPPPAEKPKPPPAEKPKPPPAEKPMPPPAEKPMPKPTPKPAEPSPPPPAPKPAEPAPPPPAPKPAEPAPPPPAPKPQPPCQPYPIGVCCSECYEGVPGGPCFYGHGGGLQPAPMPVVPAPPQPAPKPVPVGFPQPPCRPYPIGVCCSECYEGVPGGPCFNGYGGEPLPQFYEYDGYMGRPVYDSYGGGRESCINRCDNYFSEENPQGCSVM